MTRADFDPQIGRMIILRGWPDDADEHFKALSDIPIHVFTRAVDHALRTRTWFPTPSELRVDADSVTSAVPLPPAPQYVRSETAEPRTIRNPKTGVDHVVYVDREWHYDCDACSDLGQETFFCGTPTERPHPWVQFRTCDRRNEHASHEWVTACGCVETNPTIKRRRDAQRVRYAEKSVKAQR